jgi:hypothetical protein
MILDDLCLLPGWFCDIIIDMRQIESHIQIAHRCASYKVVNDAVNLLLQALEFQ